jgi:hypothetical protein
MGEDVIVFEEWEGALRAEVPSEKQRGYREAIVKFRYWLRETGRTANASTFCAAHVPVPSFLSPLERAYRAVLSGLIQTSG